MKIFIISICNKKDILVIENVFTIVNKFNNVTTALGYFIYGGSFIHIISIILFLFDPIKVNLFQSK